jgi:hypothetical protein
VTQQEITPILATRQFTQMTPDETAIARAWLMAHWPELDAVSFNVGLGNGVQIPAGTDPSTAAAALAGSQKRADIVATMGNQVTIVEVKPRLYLGTLGQLLGYQLLYHLEHPQVQRINLVAIARNATPDATEIMLAHGVHVELFPDVPVLPT